MKRFLLILLAMVLLSLPTAANIGEPKGFLGRAYTSTLALYAIADDANVFDCTATVYDKIESGYLLITAGHCFQELPEGLKFAVSDQIGGVLTPVKVLKVREEGNIDFAQLELDTKKVYPVMQLGDESTLTIGDPIIDVNFASGLGKQISFGNISTKELIPTKYCPEACRDGFLVQIFGANGSSGSVLISKKTHKVVGVVIANFGGDAIVGMEAEPISEFQTFLQRPTQAHPGPTLEEEFDTMMKIIMGK